MIFLPLSSTPFFYQLTSIRFISDSFLSLCRLDPYRFQSFVYFAFCYDFLGAVFPERTFKCFSVSTTPTFTSILSTVLGNPFLTVHLLILLN